MLFRLLSIDETSRTTVYVFSNDHTVQLTVAVPSGDGTLCRLVAYREYDISVKGSHDVVFPFHSMDPPQYLGVVVRKTKNAVHIASGNALWKFPCVACRRVHKGADVWIRAILR